MAIKEFAVYFEEKDLANQVKNELLILNEAWKKQLPPPPIVFENGEIRKMLKSDWQYKYSNVKDLIFTQKEYLDITKLKLYK